MPPASWARPCISAARAEIEASVGTAKAQIEGISADDCVADILREAKVPKTAA